MAKKQKIYIGKITKGKRKGKTGFVSFKDYVKQNIEDISPESLNKKELATYKKIVAGKQQAGKRLRIDGKFIPKEAEKRIKRYLENEGLEPTKENILEGANIRLFLTLRGNEINDIIEKHKGTVLINGVAMTKAEAQVEYDKLNRMNIREWADIIGRDEDAIYFIVYNSAYKQSTKELTIYTNVIDEGRVIVSPIKPSK
jgi:ribosomal protein S6/RNase P/RNase MRP subunit p29